VTMVGEMVGSGDEVPNEGDIGMDIGKYKQDEQEDEQYT